MLYNGGGRATDDAPPELLAAENHAKTERLASGGTSARRKLSASQLIERAIQATVTALFRSIRACGHARSQR